MNSKVYHLKRLFQMSSVVSNLLFMFPIYVFCFQSHNDVSNVFVFVTNLTFMFPTYFDVFNLHCFQCMFPIYIVSSVCFQSTLFPMYVSNLHCFQCMFPIYILPLVKIVHSSNLWFIIPTNRLYLILFFPGLELFKLVWMFKSQLYYVIYII